MKQQIINLKNLITISLLLYLTHSQFTNPGCASFDTSGNCLTCLNLYYMNAGICFPVSPLCLTYNSTNGNCLSCYNEFMIVGSGCQRVAKITNCSTYSYVTGQCTGCINGSYLNNETCVLVSILCDTYNNTNGLCKSCVNGYSLENGICNLIPISNCLNQSNLICNKCSLDYFLYNNTCFLVDSNCLVYSNMVCQNCISGFVPVNSKCVIAVPWCLSYDSNGNCLTCTPGFTLNNSFCKFTAVTIDPYCAEFNQTQCIRCALGTYNDSNGKCAKVSPLCRSFKDTTGNCLSCYNGYTLSNGSCIIISISYDPNCNQFNGTICIKCSRGYAFDINQTCVQLDQQCRIFNNTSCIECYAGYFMNSQGKCVLDTNFNCNRWVNGKCQICSFGYFMQNNSCLKIDPLCARFDFIVNKCIGCYLGYILYQDSCNLPSAVPIQIAQYSVNCAQFDSSNNCIKCYHRYYLTFDKICRQVNTLCNTFDNSNGNCLSCYNGYFLNPNDGLCLLVN